MLARTLVLSLTVLAAAEQVHSRRPLVASQITWLYANDLDKGADFLAATGFVEVPHLLQKRLCRLFQSAPAQYVGVCNSRPAPKCMATGGPEGKDAPPVTYTLVTTSMAEVDAWHAFLAPSARHNVTTPGMSTTFGCYAFNFYDTDQALGLGCYRFEVQYFTDPAWPVDPGCPPF